MVRLGGRKSRDAEGNLCGNRATVTRRSGEGNLVLGLCGKNRNEVSASPTPGAIVLWVKGGVNATGVEWIGRALHFGRVSDRERADRHLTSQTARLACYAWRACSTPASAFPAFVGYRNGIYARDAELRYPMDAAADEPMKSPDRLATSRPASVDPGPWFWPAVKRRVDRPDEAPTS